MPFRGVGVSKKLYNTNTQPRNSNNYNGQYQQHSQYYERRTNVINGIGLEVGSPHSLSQQFADSQFNNRATSQFTMPTKLNSAGPEAIQANLSQGTYIINRS